MKQPSRCVMGLGLLCAVLLAANVGQLIHHASRPADNGERDGLERRLRNLTQEKDLLQQNYMGLSKDCIEIAKQFAKMAVQAKDVPCPTGWTKFGKSCYVVSKEKKNWMASRAACKTDDAELVFIDSRAEQAFVNGLMSSGLHAWIGLTDAVKEGTWTWADGTPLNTTFWRVNQPNNYAGNEDCGETLQSSSGVGEWNDDGCSANQIFICEK